MTFLPDDELLEGNPDLGVPVARHVAGFRFEDLDVANLAAVKRLTLDTLGAGVAGLGEPGCVELEELVEEWGGAPQATVIGRGIRVPAHAAVSVNATMCRALEIDDVSEDALIHPSATVVPVALAAAELSPRPITGRELIAAIAVGIDIHNRLSSAPRVALAGPGYRPRGMSCTYQVGTMVAAAIVARLAGAGPGRVLSAIGIAYGNAAGNQQSIADRTLGVRLQQGLTAGNGIVAAQLALRGVRGPHHPFEGVFGYYPMYWRDDYDRDKVLDGLGRRLTVTDVSIKPYPCCKYPHTAVAAAIEARSDPRFDARAVERIVLTVDNAEYRSLVCDPIDEKRRPTTPIDAQFSMPYCVAVALLRGALLLDDFRPEALRDPEVLALAARVDVVWTAGETRPTLPTPGHVVVHQRGGVTLVGDAAIAPGHPRRPFSWEQTVEKFMKSVAFPARPLPPAKAASLVRAIETIEQTTDVRSLLPANLVW